VALQAEGSYFSHRLSEDIDFWRQTTDSCKGNMQAKAKMVRYIYLEGEKELNE